MGGPTVNTDAQNAEQQNQQKAQQYAAQQQQAALQGVNQWTAQNKPPGQGQAPIQGPQASSPATMGGGNIQAGAPATGQPKPPMPMPGQPQMPQPGGQPNGVQLSPQQRAHIMQLIGGQAH